MPAPSPAPTGNPLLSQLFPTTRESLPSWMPSPLFPTAVQSFTVELAPAKMPPPVELAGVPLVLRFALAVQLLTVHCAPTEIPQESAAALLFPLAVQVVTVLRSSA